MAIVTDFGCPVHTYVAGGKPLEVERPSSCPHCHAADVMIGHGFYLRKALDQTQVYLVWIKRWYCTACHRTLSMLPSFLLPFRHYLLIVIQQVVLARYEQNDSWAQVQQQCAPDQAPSLRTIVRWCRSFAEQAGRWLAEVQHTLAQHDMASPWLDPLGEAASPQAAPRALLQASVYVLAWAKTQWAALATYGLNDRLRFLWQWGFAQGLGRLL
jgi:transposase-like protein